MEFSISGGKIVFVSKNYISVYFGWLWPVQLAQTSSDQLLVHMTNRNSMVCHVNSDLDFNKGGCVIQIWVD